MKCFMIVLALFVAFCVGLNVEDYVTPDCPDPVVETVDFIALLRHVENMDSVYYRLSALSHQMDDSIVVLNEALDSTKQHIEWLWYLREDGDHD